MRLLKGTVEGVGAVATLGVLLFFVFTKGGPAWYVPVFFVSTAVLYAGMLTYLLLGRVFWPQVDRQEWATAFKPFVIGALFATGVIVIVFIATRFAR